jgi:hypothetical protein
LGLVEPEFQSEIFKLRSFLFDCVNSFLEIRKVRGECVDLRARVCSLYLFRKSRDLWACVHTHHLVAQFLSNGGDLRAWVWSPESLQIRAEGRSKECGGYNYYRDDHNYGYFIPIAGVCLCAVAAWAYNLQPEVPEHARRSTGLS